MKNHYENRGDVTVVFVKCDTLKTWHECQIETADLPKLLAINCTWTGRLARKSLTKRYAIAKQWDKQSQTVSTILMHRIICGSKAGCELHHKDNDGLNNKRDNLTQISHIENMRERQPLKDWKEYDRKQALADEYRRERLAAAQVEALFSLTRQGLWKIRTGRTRGSKAAMAYLDACESAGVRTFQVISAGHGRKKFGAVR